MIEVSNLLQQISAEEPCGPDLEYDEAFIQLELIAQYKPEQQMGDAVIPAEEPVWRDVEKAAVALFERTKDLRVAVHLAKALLHTGGFVGFARAMELLRTLIEQSWEGVHPQLDADDDNDPTMRFNMLASLGESSTVVAWARKVPLVSVRGLGSFSLRDIAVATGEVAAQEGVDTAVDPALIEAAFNNTPIEELEPVAVATRGAAQEVAKIENLLLQNAAGASPPNLSDLRAVIDQAARTVARYLSQRADGTQQEAGADEAAQGESSEGGGPAGPARPKALEGEITSRDDVMRAIDKICSYYERHEPSSPIPMLMRRCKRLVHKDFLDIIRDMAPDGLAQVEMLRGQTEEEDGSV